MIVITIKDILLVGIIGIAIIYCIIAYLWERYILPLYKKNCKQCDYWKMISTDSCGGGCKFRCTKHRNIEIHCDFNDRNNWVKCNDFTPINLNKFP